MLTRTTVVLILAVSSFLGCGGTDPASRTTCSCPALDEPTCGSDGVTYANACNAECAGTTIAHLGACGPDDKTCACSDARDPVCGANGITYENACSATCAHQAIARAGSCSSDGGTDDGGARDAAAEDAMATNDGSSLDAAPPDGAVDVTDGGECPRVKLTGPCMYEGEWCSVGQRGGCSCTSGMWTCSYPPTSAQRNSR